MRFTVLSALVAGAALLQVGASPLRVIVVTSNQETAPKFRFGHAAAHHSNDNGPVAMLVKPDGKVQGPCRGARLRQKATEISNAFRQALGFSPSVERPTRVGHGDGMVHILPFVGTPNTFLIPTPVPHNGNVVYMPHPHPHHRPHPHQQHMDRPLFMKRLHFALMALRPWEGRAVAFVLGCRIGILLRMLWVLSVVFYRVVKGTKEDDNQYTNIIVVEDFGDAEEIFVARFVGRITPQSRLNDGYLHHQVMLGWGWG